MVSGQPRQLPTFTLPGMRDKGVGDAHMAHLANDARVGEELGDAASRTTGYFDFRAYLFRYDNDENLRTDTTTTKMLVLLRCATILKPTNTTFDKRNK